MQFFFSSPRAGGGGGGGGVNFQSITLIFSVQYFLLLCFASPQAL